MRNSARMLGLIIGGFVLCWLPFFLLATAVPFCADACDVPGPVASVALWLGYSNSLLNPVIYAIWDRNFRNCFRRLATCDLAAGGGSRRSNAGGAGGGGGVHHSGGCRRANRQQQVGVTPGPNVNNNGRVPTAAVEPLPPTPLPQPAALVIPTVAVQLLDSSARINDQDDENADES